MKNWTERIGIVVAAGVLSMVLNAPPGETQQLSPRAGAVPAGGIIFTRTVFTTHAAGYPNPRNVDGSRDHPGRCPGATGGSGRMPATCQSRHATSTIH